MTSMQYRILLPSDYDMGIIRERVRLNGHKADNLESLKFKAFIISEKGKLGNNSNYYAPFYVWDNEKGMNDIVLGDFFTGIVSSFGWQKIDTYPVFCFYSNEIEKAVYAVSEIVSINDYTNLKQLREQETLFHENLIKDERIKASIVGYNPTNWTLVKFYLVEHLVYEELKNPNVVKYEVLHMSVPS